MLTPGEHLAHYRLIEKIGSGGMGEVYRAEDTRLRRDVAIKILPADFAADPGRIARFEREARTLAALNHPNIATLHGFEQAKGVRFLVMELVEGEDLAARLRRGPLPVEEAIPIFIQIADGLEAAHERGIIHGDLKPANIMVTADGRAKVLDFGLAKGTAGDAAAASGDPSESPTKTVSGTLAGAMLGPAISPDGRQIAFTELLVDGTTLWIQDTGGRNRTRFSHDGEYAYGPTWSPDGRRIAYVITDAPLFFTEDGRIVVRSTEGGGVAQELGVGSHPHFSSDGRYLVFSRKVKESKDLFLISLETGETSPIVATGANETLGRISPNGKYLAYTSDESGRGELYVTRFPSGEGRWQVSSSGGRNPHWSGAGDRLFFLRAPVALMAADVSLEPQLQIGPPRELFRAKDGEVELFMGYDVASQGDRFLVVRFHVPEPRIPSLAVVENWSAEFASGR